MKVANNKLVELPPAMASLSRLESLDLSNNRLTSLGSLELGSMRRLQDLNLQVPSYDLLSQGNSAIMLFFSVSALFSDGAFAVSLSDSALCVSVAYIFPLVFRRSILPTYTFLLGPKAHLSLLKQVKLMGFGVTYIF